MSERISDYRYLDFTHEKNGNNAPWLRITEDEIEQHQQKASNYNCFATVQRYPLPKKAEREGIHLSPLYFDLDFEQDPDVARTDLLQIVRFFTEDLGLSHGDIRVFFSGSKGFHCLIHYNALGIQPHEWLTKSFKHIAGYLKYKLSDEGLRSIDFQVYSNPRVLRLTNSVHHKTRLFKVELSLDELQMPIDDIRELAVKPRARRYKSYTEWGDNVNLAPKGAEFFRAKFQEYLEARKTSEQAYANEYVLVNNEPPVCVNDILQNGWKKDGDRNQATVQLSCYFKDAGYEKTKTTEVLKDWVQRFSSADSDYQLKRRIASTRTVVETVFSTENEYKFGCAFIRALHGEKSPSGEYERVSCAGDLCACLKQNSTQDLDDATELHLSAAGNAEYEGRLIKTQVMVAGKKSTPYIVPKRVEYKCWGSEKCKHKFCPLKNTPDNTAYVDLSVRNRELIQMCGIGDDNVKGVLRYLAKTPNCKKFTVTVLESTNVEELLVIPKVENNVTDTEGRYVLSKVYVIDNIQLKENQYYELSGFVYSHPKNQEATIMVRDARPLQDVVGSFKLTDEVKSSLKVFRPEEWTVDALGEKLSTILDHLSYNVTQIVERDEVHLGGLLVLHSLLNLGVPWDNEPIRGWVEAVIIGDTGTGKSDLIGKLLGYVGLGTRVNAEATSRTGLAYKMEQSGSSGSWYITWGAWPLADKKVIWIDEASGIPKDEYGKMTGARSSGKLEVRRAVVAETHCRARAILSGNVPEGERLSDYAQGVEALKNIFNNEDIRRFDLGLFLKTTDVPTSKYSSSLPFYPEVINAEQLRDNILFAWSRSCQHVEFSTDATQSILELSVKLSQIYGAASDVPLVSPSDQRNKVARLSTALAVLTNSVDDSGEKVIVRRCHVEFIFGYLKSVYNAPGCRLNFHAKLAVNNRELTDSDFKKITGRLKELGTLRDVEGQTSRAFLRFIMCFQSQGYLRLGDIEIMLGVTKEEVKSLMTRLVGLSLVTNTTGGYKKTARFNSYIGKCFESGDFDEIDLDYL